MKGILDYWHEGENDVDLEVLKYIVSLKKMGIINILATNQAACRLKYILDEMSLGNYFDLIIASCDIGCEKPEFEFYSKSQDIIFEKFGIGRDEIVFWDDKYDNVSGAKEVWEKSFLYVGLDNCKEVINRYF